MVALLSEIKAGAWIAALVFIVAASMDGLDGYLARLHRKVTVFGQFLDPLADKLLVSAALISLVELNKISAWIAMLIIGREFAVTAMRLVAIAKGKIVAAGHWGKAKTVMQSIALVALILPVNHLLANLLMAVAVILTVYSGFDYFMQLRGYFVDED
jgi:CDP-diacylglycerol--glycerol-3-phosphate 3-phosphatidyltransferase